MKIFLTVLLFTLASLAPDNKVYVCDSKSSVAYHKVKNCGGLSHCTHNIIEISAAEAENRGKRKCKLCWR